MILTRFLSPSIPVVSWPRTHALSSLQNVTSNHRASDTVVCEGRPQVLSGRFMYGPLDVVTLTGEKVRTQKPCHLVPRPQLLSSEQLLIPGGCAPRPTHPRRQPSLCPPPRRAPMDLPPLLPSRWMSTS